MNVNVYVRVGARTRNNDPLKLDSSEKRFRYTPIYITKYSAASLVIY